MTATCVVSTRIDPGTRDEAVAVLASMGLTVSDALRLLLIRVVREGCLPFDPLIPNEATVAAMQEARAGSLPRHGDVDTLITELRSDD